MLADFCFADLLLYVPTKDERWLIVGQVRPATGQTVYHTDWVGTFANVSERSVLVVGRSRPARSPRATSTVEDLAELGAHAGHPGALRRAHRSRVLTREWVAARRPPAGRARARRTVDLRPLRRR